MSVKLYIPANIECMENIDAIRIDFSEGTASIMNICIAFLMFGIALDMKLSDFRRIVEYPKSVAVGLTSQLLVLPLLTIALIKVWGPAPSLSLGLILIAACPGGNVSNFAVHLAKGNTALSVTMTSIVTLSAIIITPLSFSLWSLLVPETQPLLADISIEPLKMFQIILQLILIPLALGMVINDRFPKVTEYIRKPIRTLSLLIFASFIVFALAANQKYIVEYLHIIFALVVVHNVIALAAGYYFARINKRSIRDSKAICMETGIQNAGLGIVMILNFFPDYGGMMLIAAFWGVWDLISAFGLAIWWNRRAKHIEAI